MSELAELDYWTGLLDWNTGLKFYRFYGHALSSL